MNKSIRGYKINRGYTRVTIYLFHRSTMKLLGTLKMTPNPMPRRKKYEHICRLLRSYQIPVPAYKDTNSR